MKELMMNRKWLAAAAMFAALFVMSGSVLATTGPQGTKARYVFLFIGDGMAVAQRTAAELYLSARKGATRLEEVRLVMNTFPAQGMTRTYDLTSVIPDSASTSTAISCGRKTRSGVIGMDAEAKEQYENIAEVAKKKNWKVGILSTVSLDHATPAAFYAHVPSRSQMYHISMQLANSGLDYFAGGQMMPPTDKEDESNPNALETARKNGYTVAMGRASFETLKPGDGKVIAMNEVVDKDAAMYFTLDRNNDKSHVTLAEYLSKGIELLDNPNGFFIMAEAGKIDWACHANDAAAAIHDTLALDDAVAEAVKFYEKHPTETLIIVTADHETGGMSIGFAGTRHFSFVDKIQNQKMSYIELGNKLHEYKKAHTASDARFEDMLPIIKEGFGLYVMAADEKEALEKAVSAGKGKEALEKAVSEGKGKEAPEDAGKAAKAAEAKLKYSMALTDLELDVLREAFKQTMLSSRERASDDYTYLHYGGREPLAIKLTTILNNKAGIAWTSYAHTGVPVQTSALGVGAELFNGYYDQTDIHAKIMKITGLNR